MRLVVMSVVLPLVLGVTGCAAPGEDPLAWGSAAEDEVAASPAAASPEIKEKATEVATSIMGLLKMNRKWNELHAGSTTPEARREIRSLVHKLRAKLAALPTEAEWVTTYVEQHRDEIKAGFAGVLASEPIHTRLGADKIRELTEAVDRAGGVDGVILASAAVVREHAEDVGEKLGHGKRMSRAFLCGVVGTVAGANAAREEWIGVAAPIAALLEAGCIH